MIKSQQNRTAHTAGNNIMSFSKSGGTNHFLILVQFVIVIFNVSGLDKNV